MYQKAQNLVGADTIDVCLTLQFPCLTINVRHVISHASACSVFCGLAMALNLKPSPEPGSCYFHDPTALAGARGKEQSRAAGCPGMVGSCRSYKKSRLYRVCISEAVEGTGRIQGSWHPYVTTCNTISRSLSPILSQIHRQLHSQQDRLR